MTIAKTIIVIIIITFVYYITSLIQTQERT